MEDNPLTGNWLNKLSPHPPRVVWRLMHYALTMPMEEGFTFSDSMQACAVTMQLLLRGKQPDLAQHYFRDKPYYYGTVARLLGGYWAWHEKQDLLSIKLAEIIASESKNPHHYYVFRG